MNVSAPFIYRPIATSLLMVAILMGGLFAYALLPISSLPEVEYPTIQVQTFFPGASPDVMTSSVTAPLERQFGEMPGLNQMTSTSSNGASIITLQFSLDMSLDVAEQEVQAAINTASTYLPVNLPIPPVYNKVNPADTPILTLAITSPTLALSQVEDYADTRIAQRIAQQSGVGLVSLTGGQRPAVRVQMNPDALAAYGLALEDVRNAIIAANVNAPKGNFDGKRLSYTINTNDQLLKSVSYRPLIIAYRNNAPVRLSDIAEVTDGVENNKLAAWMNKKPAIIMNIQRQPGVNVIAVADRVKQLLTKMADTLPTAINIHVLTDQTTTIRASVRDVQLELLLSVFLVITVIFIFLRNLSATIIPSISVPLSLIGALSLMYLFNFSLNNLTLMGLTIAAGFVVDDAIVMIENIARYIEAGDPPLQAALKGSKQISFTIISLTVSLIAVLIPLLFMSDLIGRLFREFALTLTFTIFISAFVSLTLTPMLCSRLLYHRDHASLSNFEKRAESIQQAVVERYQISLQWVLNHQPLTLIIALITLIVTLALFFIVPKGFFPVQDTGTIQGITEAGQSISFSAMAERQQALADIVLANPNVESLSSFIGIDGTNITLNSGRMLINLKPLSKRSKRAIEVIRELQPKLARIPGIMLYMQPVQDLTVDTQISRTQYQFSLSGADTAEVNKWSTLLLNRLITAKSLADAATDQQNLGLQTHIAFDRDTASKLGLTAQMIDDTLYDAFGQRQISTIFTQSNQYRVVLEIAHQLQQQPLSLDNIYLISTTGKSIPLHTFTDIRQAIGPTLITRLNQFPAATLSFNLTPQAVLGDAVQEINQIEKDIHIPPHIQTSFEGTAKVFQSSLNNEGWLVLAAIIVVYIVLGILYESYIHPITILSTLPSATMGALLALLISGNELSVIALIGIILLIGIVMKNAIMMIDFALEQERTYKKSARDAIYEAALLRFRPIIMTTLASLLGAIPLAFGTGMGAELRHPLGIAIIGGLLISQLLTLYTTPVVYLAFDRIKGAILSWHLFWLKPPSPPQESQ